MTQDRSLEIIGRLRRLREDERSLRRMLVYDLAPFQKSGDGSFFTLPVSDRKGISVASTCTALMALVDGGEIASLFPERGPTPGRLFTKVVGSSWRSSKLPDLNAFTSCMVIRAAGYMVSAKNILPGGVVSLSHKRTELRQIAQSIAADPMKGFSVKGYPAKATMAYWFVDGVTQAGIKIDPKAWKSIAVWSAREFERQLSYVGSGNDALMDPASLAMAASLISKLRKYFTTQDDLSQISESLPSKVELINAVVRVFEQQADSGIWHKYFPLFHFPGSGAADYCFSFEFLEAILIEFTEFDILLTEAILARIEKSVAWCLNNRLEFRKDDQTFFGWNAGGELKNLVSGMPEAWTTASVHMFLAELDSSISESLKKLLLRSYGVTETSRARTSERWDALIDVSLSIQGNRTVGLKDTIRTELIDNKVFGQDTDNWLPQSRAIARRVLPGRRSALLFGPPGTSKTTIAEVVADRLGWPLVVVNPSHFLSKGFEQIYVRANEIFEDLMDLSNVVVLLDEMDALVQTRESPHQINAPAKSREQTPGLDVTRQLLTTSMLPKIADLHKRAQVIFLMATNHKQQLDPAITRSGRFDLLLCVGPPKWQDKLNRLEQVWREIPATDLAAVKVRLGKLSAPKGLREMLDKFTVGDLKGLLQSFGPATGLRASLGAIKESEFEKILQQWTDEYIIMNAKGGMLREYEDDYKGSRIQ